MPMISPRIIPCLDLRAGRVVTGVQFTGLRDAGDPLELARFYLREGAAEIFLLDIAASPGSRALTGNLVQKIWETDEVSLTVGGGIDSADTAGQMLQCGAARVSLGSAALDNPPLIDELARLFGSERIVAAIDARSASPESAGPQRRWEVYSGGGRDPTGRDAVEWAREVEQRGAGEILLTSMDTDGTRQGYNLPLLQAVTAAISLPVIASGGAGKLEHLFEALSTGGADAVLAASILHENRFTIPEIKDFLVRRLEEAKQNLE